MSRPLGEPSLDDIDAILRFLPAFDRPDCEVGDFEDGTAEDGSPLPRHFAASPTLIEFLQALQDHSWVYEFDWTEWQPVAERYAKNDGLLADAGLGTIRKILTTHVRREHFEDGHLAGVVRSGHVAAVLRRLQALRGDLARSA